MMQMTPINSPCHHPADQCALSSAEAALSFSLLFKSPTKCFYSNSLVQLTCGVAARPLAHPLGSILVVIRSQTPPRWYGLGNQE